MPPVSPERTIAGRRAGSTFGCLEIACDNDRPRSMSLLHLADDLGERLRLGLLGQDAEGADQREAGADHRGQLAGEDRDVREADLVAPLRMSTSASSGLPWLVTETGT